NTAGNLARKLDIADWSHFARGGYGLLQLGSDFELHGYNFGLFFTGCNHADDDHDGQHHRHDDSDNDLLFATQCHSFVPFCRGPSNSRRCVYVETYQTVSSKSKRDPVQFINSLATKK